MKHASRYIATLACAVAALTVQLPAHSQSHADHGKSGTPETAGMTAGEVRKVDVTQSKITIRHEEIRHLQMPPMTMVFSVTSTGQLEGLKPGDQVIFRVIRESGAFVVTDIQLRP